jgi:hypothetical protein
MAEPTTKQRFDGIDSRLDRIERALELKPPEPKSAFAQFRGHVWQLIVVNRSWVISVAAILVAIGGWFGSGMFKYWLDHKDDGLNHLIDGRIEAALKAPSGVLATLSEVQRTTNETDTTLKTLQPFIQDVIRHQFEIASKLPAQELGERLPAVKNLLAVARDQDVQIEPKITENLREKLLKIDAKAPDYWPASAQFISYRSQNTVPDTQSLLQPNLPNCTDHDPEGPRIESTNGNQITFSSAYYDNCRLTLDSAKDDAKINSLLLNLTPKIVFRHCLIVYKGGEIGLIIAFNNRPVKIYLPEHPEVDAVPSTTPVTGNTLYFNNCLFKLDLNHQPPSGGQKFTQNLLATNGPDFSFTISKSQAHN